jgi:DNA-binding MarR family transcriptional regulator
VARGRDAADGRVALISLTADRAAALEEFRRRYRGALAERLHAMSDAELAELDGASRTLGRLVRQHAVSATCVRSSASPRSCW